MSTGHQSRTNRSIDWLLIARIMAVQVLILMALAGAAVWYVNWSSEAVWQEFLSAHKPPLSAPNEEPSHAPLQTVNDKAVCVKKR